MFIIDKQGVYCIDVYIVYAVTCSSFFQVVRKCFSSCWLWLLLTDVWDQQICQAREWQEEVKPRYSTLAMTTASKWHSNTLIQNLKTLITIKQNISKHHSKPATRTSTRSWPRSQLNSRSLPQKNVRRPRRRMRSTFSSTKAMTNITSKKGHPGSDSHDGGYNMIDWYKLYSN